MLSSTSVSDKSHSTTSVKIFCDNFFSNTFVFLFSKEQLNEWFGWVLVYGYNYDPAFSHRIPPQFKNVARTLVHSCVSRTDSQ